MPDWGSKVLGELSVPVIPPVLAESEMFLPSQPIKVILPVVLLTEKFSFAQTSVRTISPVVPVEDRTLQVILFIVHLPVFTFAVRFSFISVSKTEILPAVSEILRLSALVPLTVILPVVDEISAFPLTFAQKFMSPVVTEISEFVKANFSGTVILPVLPLMLRAEYSFWGRYTVILTEEKFIGAK